MHSLANFKDGLISIESSLRVLQHNCFQHTDREIEKVFLFHAVYLNLKERKIEAFMRVPGKPDLSYEIDMSRTTVPTLDFIIQSGDAESDIARVKSEIPKLFATACLRVAAIGKPGGGGAGQKGFYLLAGKAKARALATFQAAVRDGVASNDFVQFCVSRNFKMKHCPSL